MNNVLIFSDLHITQSSLKECTLILEEIGMLANKYNVDMLINLGDTFDSIKPTSAELDIYATFIRRLDKKIITLAANSHESETEERSILNHYGILSDNVIVVKEFKDEKHLYCGHFSIKESANNYGATLSKEQFKEYLYVFLGHVHSYQLIKPNILHLGSCRYVDFAEAEDKHKIVALITDYGTESEKVHFLKLNSPIPMIQLELSKNKENPAIKDASEPKNLVPGAPGEEIHASNSAILAFCQKLDKIDPKTKVKVKILDFESFRQFLPFVNKYSSKFEVFKYTTDFMVIAEKKDNSKTELISFKESFTNWLKNQKIDNKIKEILQKELDNA
jgi:DNA repair exonuclease SbcCD nuclease subunit